MTRLRLHGVVKFRCPFCASEVEAGFDESDDPAVLHLEPVCEVFLVLEPDDYMHAVNDAIAGPAGADAIRKRIAGDVS